MQEARLRVKNLKRIDKKGVNFRANSMGLGQSRSAIKVPPPPATVADLPDEILLKCLNGLGWEDLPKAAAVSKGWNRLVSIVGVPPFRQKCPCSTAHQPCQGLVKWGSR